MIDDDIRNLVTRLKNSGIYRLLEIKGMFLDLKQSFHNIIEQCIVILGMIVTPIITIIIVLPLNAHTIKYTEIPSNFIIYYTGSIIFAYLILWAILRIIIGKDKISYLTYYIIYFMIGFVSALYFEIVMGILLGVFELTMVLVAIRILQGFYYRKINQLLRDFVLFFLCQTLFLFIAYNAFLFL